MSALGPTPGTASAVGRFGAKGEAHVLLGSDGDEPGGLVLKNRPSKAASGAQHEFVRPSRSLLGLDKLAAEKRKAREDAGLGPTPAEKRRAAAVAREAEAKAPRLDYEAYDAAVRQGATEQQEGDDEDGGRHSREARSSSREKEEGRRGGGGSGRSNARRRGVPGDGSRPHERARAGEPLAGVAATPEPSRAVATPLREEIYARHREARKGVYHDDRRGERGSGHDSRGEGGRRDDGRGRDSDRDRGREYNRDRDRDRDRREHDRYAREPDSRRSHTGPRNDRHTGPRNDRHTGPRDDRHAGNSWRSERDRYGRTPEPHHLAQQRQRRGWEEDEDASGPRISRGRRSEWERTPTPGGSNGTPTPSSKRNAKE